MKLKMAKFMSVVTIALLLAGCGAKSEETPIPDDSEVQSEEAVSEKAESASSRSEERRVGKECSESC